MSAEPEMFVTLRVEEMRRTPGGGWDYILLAEGFGNVSDAERAARKLQARWPNRIYRVVRTSYVRTEKTLVQVGSG